MDNAEKPKRKRKRLNIDIDTKNVDIKIVRDENGTTNVDIDTPRIDVHEQNRMIHSNWTSKSMIKKNMNSNPTDHHHRCQKARFGA